MGGRGSSAPTGGDPRNRYGARGGHQATPTKSATTQQNKRTVNKAVVDNWIDSQYARRFLGDAPETISVGGVEFRWIGDSTRTESTGKVYINTYQSTEQASNGEWPVIETVVRERKRKGWETRYQFDRSSTGTGLK